MPFLILLPLLLSIVVAQPPAGLTLEACLSDLGCTAPRRCVSTTNFRRCRTPSTESACACIPPSFTPCTASKDCIEGEVCARSLQIPFVCTSAAVAVPPNGPLTKEESDKKPLIPNCPVQKRKRSARRSVRMPAPPAAPPGLPPGAPPVFEPVPGPPAPPPPEITAPKRNALNLEICRPGTCAPGLSCVTLEDGFPAGPPPDGARSGGQSFRCCEEKDPVCLCHPKDSRPVCLSTADCNPGELCVKTPVAPPTCTSNADLERLSAKQKRRVFVLKGKRPGKPGKRVPLVARPKPSPDVVEETPQDTPAELEVESSPSPSASASPSVVDTSSTPEASPGVQAQDVDGICIDAEALRHLDRSDLVFEHDRLARVLCDAGGSCATGGHMVGFKGKVMMMRSYCEIVGCEEKVIKVNSPRYRRGMTVESRTEGLGYTCLAARFGTRVEERVLAGVIRVGL